MSDFHHISVLKEECISFLTEINFSSDPVFADCTFGGGGHSFSLIEREPSAKLLGFDQDPDAFNNALKNIKEKKYENNICLVYSNFSDFLEKAKEFLTDIKRDYFDGVLMDLGVSSHQFDIDQRGFSFRSDAILDMRMNYQEDSRETAQDIVNNYSVERLVDIFEKYGEEKFSKRIAQKIEEERNKKRIEKTKELENIIFHAYPAQFRHGKTAPATKVFQALRIEVNKELEVLEKTLSDIKNLLHPDHGRLAVISFHSLEDRIVKHEFKNWSKAGGYRLLTKKPVVATEEEIIANRRSRSAKLRVVERSQEAGAYGKRQKYRKES